MMSSGKRSIIRRKIRREEEQTNPPKKGRTKLTPTLSDKKLRDLKSSNVEFNLVVPIETKSLPWCLYSKENNNPAPYQGTPADFVVKNILAEFKYITSEKIAEFLRITDENFILTELFTTENTKILNQVIKSLIVVSKTHGNLSFVVHSLIKWRENLHDTPLKDIMKANTSASAPVIQIKTKDLQNLLEERQYLLVEYFFGTTVLSLVETRTESNYLSEELVDSLLSIAIDTPLPSTKVDKTDKGMAIYQNQLNNKKEILKIYERIIGSLSKYHFMKVTEKLWQGLPAILSASKASKIQGNTRLDGLKQLQVQLSTQIGVNETLNLLEHFADVLKNIKLNKEIQLVFSQAIVSVLQRVAAQRIADGVDYHELHRLLANLYEKFYSSIKKKNREILLQTWYPLLSAILASLDEKFFSNNWTELISTMAKPLREKNLRPTLLQSIKILIEAYCLKFSNNDAKLSVNLDTIRNLIFPSKISKSTIGFQGETTSNLELFVDIIVTISKRDLDYALRKIVFEFIRADALRGDTQPEKVYIAIRSIYNIYEFIQSNPKPDQLPIGQVQNYNISEYLVSICDFFGQLIGSLDGVFGNWLLQNQSRSILDLIQKERATVLSFVLLRSCISSIPSIIPSTKSEGELVGILVKYLTHIDTDLRERSWTALSSLMKSYPNYRSHIVSGLVKFLLTIPELKSNILCMVMQKIEKIIHFWNYILKEPQRDSQQQENQPSALSKSQIQSHQPQSPILSPTNHPSQSNVSQSINVSPLQPSTAPQTQQRLQESNQPLPSSHSQGTQTFNRISLGLVNNRISLDLNTINEIEAILLICLANPDPEVRELTLNILHGVRLLANWVESDSSSPLGDLASSLLIFPPRIIDIIDESGPDILYNLKHDFRFTTEHEVPSELNSVDSFAISKHQMCWSYCLGEVTKIIVELCPGVISYLKKYNHLRIEDIVKTGLWEQENFIHLWRNYLTLSSIVSSEIQEAKEVYNTAVHLIKSEAQRGAVIFALQRSNLGSLEIVFDIVKVLENDASIKKMKKKEKMRISLSSIISSIAESLPRGYLIEYDKLRNSFLNYINEQYELFLNDASNQSITSMIGIYNFSSVIQSVALDVLASEIDLIKATPPVQIQNTGSSHSRGESISQPISSSTTNTSNTQSISASTSSIPLSNHGSAINHSDAISPRLSSTIEVDLRLKIFKLLSQWTIKDLQHELINLHAEISKKKNYSQSTYENVFFEMKKHSCFAIGALLIGKRFTTGNQLFQSNSSSSVSNAGSASSNSNSVHVNTGNISNSGSAVLHSSNENTFITSDDVVLTWIRKICKSDPLRTDEPIIYALSNYFQGNCNSKEMASIALDNCYSSEKDLADVYFLALVEFYKNDGNFESCSFAMLIHLILFKLGDSNGRIRNHAIKLLNILASDKEEEYWANNYYHPGINSSLFELSGKVQFNLSIKLANEYPNQAFELFNEFIYRLDQPSIEFVNQQKMLKILIPWIKKMKLSILTMNELPEFLQNLFWMTVKFINENVVIKNIMRIWKTLANNEENISYIIDYIVFLGIHKKNQLFIEIAKKVIFYIAITNVKVTINNLINELSTIKILPRSKSESILQKQKLNQVSSSESNSFSIELDSNSKLYKIMPDITSYSPPARGHFALVLLSEISYSKEITYELSNHLPIVLHQVILGLDNSNPLVFNHCGYILYNLIQYLIILPPQQQEEEDDESLEDDHSEEDEDNPSGTYENNFQSIRRNYQYKKSKNTIKANKQQQKIEEEEQKEEIMRMKGNLIIEYLESKRGIQFWEREDINQDHPQIKSTSQLCTLVILILDCLSIKFPNLREEWGPEAFAWAISCPDSHWRCRSFQIYRSLKPQASAEIINNLLSILIKYLQINEATSCGIILETLYTLQTVATNTNLYVLFNRIFWTAVTLLYSDYEIIYINAITTISIILDRVSFQDKSVKHIFLAGRPKIWPSGYFGIIAMLLKGLLSSKTEPHSIELMIKISLLPANNEIFYPSPDCLLTTLLGLQVWLCTYLADEEYFRKCIFASEILSKLCASVGLLPLSRIYASVSVFKTVGIFLTEWSKAIAEAFFPRYQTLTMEFLIELLQEGHRGQKALLWIFHSIIQYIDVNIAEYNPFVPHWYGLVTQFISTDMWKEALQALEVVVQHSPLSLTQLDISLLLPFRTYRKATEFPNRVSEGNKNAATCLEQLITATECNNQSSPGETIISPRAFSKFFSTGDMDAIGPIDQNQPSNQQQQDENTDSAESFEDSDDDDLIDDLFTNTKPRRPELLDDNNDWNDNLIGGGGVGSGGGNLSFFDDILSDLQKETES